MTIVVAGADELVARTVDSALAQTEPALDVLVLGTAATPPVVAAQACVRALALPGATQGALLQAGLELARAPYVLFARAGDVLQPSCVAQHLATLEAFPPATLTACHAASRAARSGAGTAASAEGTSRGGLLRALLGGRSVPLGSLLLRRDAALAAGGFDPTFGARADDDLLLRLLPCCTVRALDAAQIALADDHREDASDAALAERGRALVRACAAFTAAELVAALGDGAWRSPGEALLELAGILAASPVAEAAALARRFALEALQHGAQPPTDAAAEALHALAPELAQPGLAAALQAGGGPLPGEVPPALVTPEDGPRAALFPPRVELAIWAPGGDSRGAGALLARAAELRGCGIDLVLIGTAHDAGLDAWTGAGVRVELLQWPDSAEEMAALFARCATGVLLAAPGSTIADVARDAGLVVLDPLGGDLPADQEPAALLRRLAAAAAARAREARLLAAGAQRALAAERAASGALRLAADGLRDPGSLTGNAEARTLWSGLQRHDLAVMSGEAATLATLASATRARAQHVLDKLRLGHRFDQGVRALRRRLHGGGAGGIATLDGHATEAFLAGARAASGGWLWLVYATDPYSETRGQRSTWIAQELARRGHRVIYLYWRWQQSEPVPSSGEANVLIAAIDQLPVLQARLLELRAPALRRVLLIEFPDVALYERLNLFNAHGWTTVYDCIDEWQEFGRIGQAGWYDLDVERHLARDADVVVATHPRLAAKLGAMAERTVPLVPNGVKLDALPAPGVPRTPGASAPVIGYFGHLTSSWFDWQLLCDCAARNPGWRFEIYGYGQPEDLALPPNVVAPGMLPHDELAARTAHWSVAIIPFREGPLTQAVDPVKLYEYLALGLPVVAVDMPYLRQVPGVVVCERGGFDAALRRALATPLDDARVAAFVAGSRWERRVDALLALIEDADPARNVVKALAG